MVYVTNSFSLNMLEAEAKEIKVKVKRISKKEAINTIFQYCDIYVAGNSVRWGLENIIGHEDLAKIVRNDLGINLPDPERKTITIDPYDKLIVAQYVGERLPEGTTELPENATIKYFLVEIENEIN